jgi:chemotaxis protein methyltransferase CheR
VSATQATRSTPAERTEAARRVELGSEGPALLGDREFELARQLIAEWAGIKLSPHKRYMVHNRLLRRVRERGLRGFPEYMDLVQAEPAEREPFVNALTTNLTSFFREPHHFELLRVRALQHRERERRPLRIWSSACSTGEEAWSIAMTLREAGCPGDVLATDIDTNVLETGDAGIYPAERTDALAPERLRAHFLKGAGENEGWVSIRPELRGMVRFRQLNLQAEPWPAMDLFDVIFCRNVAIYFDREAQRRILARFATLLRPQGLLAVGHAESFPASNRAFRACGRTAYEYLP